MNSSEKDRDGGDDVSAVPGRILVVDDEEIIRDLLTEILTQDGHEVTTAIDGQEAVDLLEPGRFDLIMTDMVMPRLNGIEVLRAANGLDPPIPVVIMTGYPSVENVVRLIRRGASDYITKPFNVDLVRVTVAKILEMRSRSQEPPEPNSPEADDPPGGDFGQQEHANPGPDPPRLNRPIDELTGAYASDLFGQMLDTEIERSEWRGHPCSLLIAEMDNLGPLLAREDGQAIDESLKRFAHALRNETRPGDVMGRTAPLELAVIMPETGIPEAVEVGQEILSTVGRHYTISAGVACFPVHAANPKGLLDRAREALEAAKSQGGNAVVHLDDALPGVRGLRPIR